MGDIITYGENPTVFWNFKYDYAEDHKNEKLTIINILNTIEPEIKYDEKCIKFNNFKYNKNEKQPEKGEWDKLILKRIRERTKINNTNAQPKPIEEKKNVINDFTIRNRP